MSQAIGYNRQCYNCGSWFQASVIRQRVLCPDCKDLREQEKHKRKSNPEGYRFRSSRFSNHPLVGYHIVHDPDPVCGYMVGAVFPKEEVLHMLTPTCRGFNPGTIIEDTQNNRFLIVARKNGGLKKVPWQKEQTEIKN